MILPRYRIAASLTARAGKGLVHAEPFARGGLILAVDDLRNVYKWNAIVATLADCAIGHALRVGGHG